MTHRLQGRLFGAKTSDARGLSALERGVIYMVKSISDKPTRYGSWVIDVEYEDDCDTISVFVPQYVYRDAEVGKRFVYNGLQPTKRNPGHTFHQLLWELTDRE